MATQQIRQANYTDYSNDFNELNFVIRQRLAELQTALLVKVVKVKADTGMVDVQPLVQQISADSSVVDHGVIYNVPFYRSQGGNNGIIINPAVDDIGVAIFCSRDISAVKNAKQIAPPSSRRMHSFSDGLYIGGFLNADAQRFIKFGENGIEINPKDLLKINGNLTVTGTIECDILKANNIILGGVDLSKTISDMKAAQAKTQKDIEDLKKMLIDQYIVQAFTDAPNAPFQ